MEKQHNSFSRTNQDRSNLLSQERQMKSTSSGIRFSPIKSISPTKPSSYKSPNKISWVRASDEELLSRLQGLADEAGDEADECGGCVREIISILQGKMQDLLTKKLEERKKKRETEEYLRKLNEDTAKMKSDLFNAEAYLGRLMSGSSRCVDELQKLEGKISEVDDQISNIGEHGKAVSFTEKGKLSNSEQYLDQVQMLLNATAAKENSLLESLTQEESNMNALFVQRCAECDSLKEQLAARHEKESSRQGSFRTVSATIEGFRSSRVLK